MPEERPKHVLLAWALIRLSAAITALGLFPFVFREHFLVLVLLRPSQGMMLAGGYLSRFGDVALPAVLVAAFPMQIVAVWLYYALGRAWAEEIDSDDRLPFLAARLLHRGQVRRLREVVRSSGALFPVLARFAAFPVGLVAATAGSSGLPARRYLAGDAAAALVATSASVGVGYGLGVAHDRAGPWLAVVGVIGLAAMSLTLTMHLRRGAGSNS